MRTICRSGHLPMMDTRAKRKLQRKNYQEASSKLKITEGLYSRVCTQHAVSKRFHVFCTLLSSRRGSGMKIFLQRTHLNVASMWLIPMTGNGTCGPMKSRLNVLIFTKYGGAVCYRVQVKTLVEQLFVYVEEENEFRCF